MQRKHKLLTSLMSVGICAALALSAASSMAADANDPTGTWTWNGPAGRGGRRGGANADPNAPAPAAPVLTLKLKLDAGKLTGTLTRPGRGGGDPTDTEITDGKVDGAKISFSIVNQGNNGSTTNKYEGTIAGDTITGTQPAGRGGRGGRRGGANAAPADPNAPPAPTTQEWIAKRSK